MLMQALILAAMAGWTFDDFCGTPPRPWPGPGPGPWWIRKILAALGGIAANLIFQGGVVNETLEAVSIIIVGGVGGVFLPSVVGGLMNAGRMTAER